MISVWKLIPVLPSITNGLHYQSTCLGDKENPSALDAPDFVRLKHNVRLQVIEGTQEVPTPIGVVFYKMNVRLEPRLFAIMPVDCWYLLYDGTPRAH